MAHDWDIKSRGEACAGCETPYMDGQKYHAALVFDENGYSRADYCETCWKTKMGDGMHYSVWQGVFKMPPTKEEALKKETAESLLRKMMEDEDESKINVIYILALMLERKKIFIERDVRIREDGRMIRVYEHRKTNETFIIPDPRLRLNELEKVQEEVVLMLGGTVPKDKISQPETRPAEEAGESTQPAKKDAGVGAEHDNEEDEYDDEDDDED